MDEEIRAGAANEVLCHHVCERCREAGRLESLAKPDDPGCLVDVTGREIGSLVPEVLMSLEVEPTGVIDVTTVTTWLTPVMCSSPMQSPNRIVSTGTLRLVIVVVALAVAGADNAVMSAIRRTVMIEAFRIIHLQGEEPDTLDKSGLHLPLSRFNGQPRAGCGTIPEPASEPAGHTPCHSFRTLRGLTCAIGIASSVEGLPGRAFQVCALGMPTCS